jgi:hypothetical protein
MLTDAERWRFLADHKLTLHTDTGDYGYMVHWVRSAGPSQPPEFHPVSNGRTAEQAIDRAIDRYNRKHGVPQPNREQMEREPSVVRLPFRGWVS